MTLPTFNDHKKKPLENFKEMDKNDSNQHFFLSCNVLDYFNPLPHNPKSRLLTSPKQRELTTLWEKEKMLPFLCHSEKEYHFVSHIYFVICKYFQFGPV